MKIKENTRKQCFRVAAALCLEMVICCNISACGRDGEYLPAPTTEQSTEYRKASEAAETEPSIFQEESRDVVPLGKTICVYICGEVNAPGVYTFDHEARLCEAIEMAGGFTAEAGENYWNLALVLQDSQMIYVPTREEAEVYKQLGIDPEGMLTVGHKTEVLEDSNVEQSGDGSGATGGRVNINTADAAQLMTIPGIGETRARSILDYRDAHGAFKKVEDITKVSGIKGATFAKIEDYITVD